MTSAYPKSIDELIPQAKRLARELGALPSQNKLKATLHVRAERAKAVLAALTESGFDPTEPAPDTPAPRRLHVVPAEPAEPAVEFSDLSGTLPLESETVDTPDTGSAQSTDAGEPVTVVGRVNRVRAWAARTQPGSASPAPAPQPVATARPVHRWPLVLLAAPAFVAIWSGWVGLGVLTGFGMVHPLPGIADGFTLNSAITLPIGVETYAAYALRVWLAADTAADTRARAFAKWSAIGALMLGAAGQVAYHLMTARHVITAPWPITTAVSCLPVIVLGFGAALAHLQHTSHTEVTR